MKIFSFDAETNGLWGTAFSIAALVYENGVETARFLARCPIEGETNPWVKDNVLPKMEDIMQTHNSYEAMLASFAEFYKEHKQDANIVVHMGVPVESRLFADMHTMGFIGDWDAPYPLLDVAGMLLQAGEDPTSVDAYANKYAIEVGENNTHNPLYDSEVAAKVFVHLMGRR